jgi:hypothetical protein
MHVIPALFNKGFRKIKFYEHTWGAGGLERVDDFMH